MKRKKRALILRLIVVTECYRDKMGIGRKRRSCYISYEAVIKEEKIKEEADDDGGGGG